MNLPNCPFFECSLPFKGPRSGSIIRHGFFRRKCDRKIIPRYRCSACRKSFSERTRDPGRYQKRPDLNERVRDLLCSSVSQRRCARLLSTTRRTVVRKFRFMALEARRSHRASLKAFESGKLRTVQFDDLITSEHTKCKPLSVSLAVHPETRMILGFEVSQIPARHPLIEISLRKYGPRKDERPEGLERLFRRLRGITSQSATFRSDQDVAYPAALESSFPAAPHERFRSRRGAVTGFAELKRIGFDPLFSLNHTCAMLRANMNRLARKTWCTTKTRLGLIQHLDLYVEYHNRHLPRLPTI